ncbi:helix-turn-helix domain-containing protein [Paraburkholderia antibiotica]|uniref:Helix-turn-helix domain-containing protein n=1 Tax=Paraburkholderia antibiotica TaxID=2728839 RepID=A0A7X9X2H7_9BURK|nr:helix-turn-helix domain-containing protein [Paraburkholderia antibiotica]NML30225.1 helix-turn-helix domain-containing protein [Paraburkholderia antibiotica]
MNKRNDPQQDDAKQDDATAQGPAIQSLARGLRVLALLGSGASFGFLQLQRESGLSKATTARILQTLEHEGWVSRRMVDGRYHLSGPTQATDAMTLALGRLTELAAEPLRRMQRETLWPSDISICDGFKMVILESNRGNGPLTINRRIMGLHPRMLWSAVGRAYLAACPLRERQRILKNLASSAHPDDLQVANKAWVRQVLADTESQGYGMRAADYPSPDQAFPGQLSALAVPIRVRGHVIACLSLIWIVSMANHRQIAGSYLELMRRTADAIGVEFEKHGFDKPLWLDSRFS